MKERAAVIKRSKQIFRQKTESSICNILCMLTCMLRYIYIYFKSLHIINTCQNGRRYSVEKLCRLGIWGMQKRSRLNSLESRCQRVRSQHMPPTMLAQGFTPFISSWEGNQAGILWGEESNDLLNTRTEQLYALVQSLPSLNPQGELYFAIFIHLYPLMVAYSWPVGPTVIINPNLITEM